MPSVYAQVRFPASSGVTEDDVMNTFAFTGTDSAASQAAEIRTRLDQFYSSTPSGGDASVVEYMASLFDFADTTLKVYDLADPMPRVPVFDGLLELTDPSTSATTLPSECAVCISFQAAAASGVSVRRRRGRVYIGPLNFLASTAAVNDPARPSTEVMDDLAATAQRMALLNDAGCSWGVWSRADELVRPIVSGWVDNAFDTQRRRGEDPTSRTPWTTIIP